MHVGLQTHSYMVRTFFGLGFSATAKKGFEMKAPTGWYMVPVGTERMSTRNAWLSSHSFEVDTKTTEITYGKYPQSYETEFYSVRDGTRVTNAGFRVSDVIPIKRKPFPKDEAKKATKNSTWRVKEDGFFVTTRDKYNLEFPKIPVGTEFTIISKKSIMSGHWTSKEKLVEHDNPDYPQYISMASLAHMECVEEGDDYEYWKLLDGHDKPVATKRYKTYEAAIGAARYRLGDIQSHDQYWLENDEPIKFDNWKAVKFDDKDQPVEIIELASWYKEKFENKQTLI